MRTAAPAEARRAAGVTVVPGRRRSRAAGSVVLAAVDDDAGAGPVLAYARERAARLGVPLRAVHVWAEHRRGVSAIRGDEMAEACHLLAERVAEHVAPDGPVPVERQILHDRDPVRALIALSREGLLLVVAARPDGGWGSTVQQLAGRTWCALAVVAATPATRGRW